jgi:hypothetical protein
MVQGKWLLVAVMCGGLLACGCNQSNTPGDQAAEATPEGLIGEFLEAVRTGDDDKASRLLTPLARKKTAEMEMVVAPPGSDTAKFKVLEVEIDGQEAHVSSDWIDLDGNGQPHTDRIVWFLRKEADGWRIFGMATRVFPDLAPIVLNFEEPQDMLRKQQQAEEEIARRDQQSEASKNSPAKAKPKVR